MPATEYQQGNVVIGVEGAGPFRYFPSPGAKAESASSHSHFPPVPPGQRPTICTLHHRADRHVWPAARIAPRGENKPLAPAIPLVLPRSYWSYALRQRTAPLLRDSSLEPIHLLQSCFPDKRSMGDCNGVGRIRRSTPEGKAKISWYVLFHWKAFRYSAPEISAGSSRSMYTVPSWTL